ncbi:MAG: hypothetical protein JSS69_14615 [Acidobacteria bacterium]|nr:hypothetical protein [Acidobacteriota bacterium]MBS1867144.1 hypothetical protein [Acidobacteriota bacterium]
MPATHHPMADWKQITARIRRAKGSKDPAGQLSNLFQKTRDAMVAFELARHFEIVSKPEDAAKWYALSWQRFRRGDWKTKAQDAITRLGGALPAEGEILPVPEVARTESSETPSAASGSEPEAPVAIRESGELHGEVEDKQNSESEAGPAADSAQAVGGAPERRGRRRGRRGGRNRRKGGTVPEQVPASNAKPPMQTAVLTAAREAEVAPPRVVDARSIPRVPVESATESGGPGVKGRFGDPGLSSRLSVLEMQFRRLLTCPAVKLDQADRAPAGPGVFVLTDDEMTTYYYVEACDTLRIAIGNMARGGSNRRTGISIKPLLADHLGIPEARVTKYLSDHCVVRWLQLDEGADYFAHFVIAVLRPTLNS